MTASQIKHTLLALSIGLTVTTTLTPQVASAAGLFDWLLGSSEPAPPPPPPRGRNGNRPGRPLDLQPWYPRTGDGIGGVIDDGTLPPVPPGNEKDAAINEFRTQPTYDMPMYITKTEWSENDEANFGKFVAQLGRAISTKKCGSVKRCMQNPEANMFADMDPPGLILYSDCADFPYFLRAYFAYHVGLPMGFVTDIDISTRPVASEPNRDADLLTAREDNSPYGNIVQRRGGANVTRTPGQEPNFQKYVERLFDNVSTRTLRVGPFYPNYDLFDFYPVKMNRAGIRPGTLLHSTGHAGLVWNVSPKGVVQFIDAHPDGSVSAKEVKASTLDRSRPDQGLGLFRFRPLKLVGGQKTETGALYGGRLTPATDAELYQAGKYSLEQWYGPGSNIAPGTQVDPTLWKSGFKKQGFFDVLASRLRDTSVIVRADEDVLDLMTSLCNEMRQRVEDVDLALTKKGNLNLEPHIPALPQNIFNSERPWEDFSTPGRDGRMKASVEDILKTAVSKFKQAKAGDPNLKFDGTAQEYAKALRDRLAGMNKSCVIKYTNSKGVKVPLTFSQVVSRLNKMSFDPYHCAERRWGASGTELASCRDTDSGGVWYEAQKYMRNTVGKLTASEALVIRSDRPITLEMLRDTSLIDQPDSSPINLGTAKAPIMELDKNFASERFIELLTK